MGRVVVTEFVSLDGVMEAPGGDDDFERGAWTFEFDRGTDGEAFKTDETMDAEALLLGRKTYEAFATAWPQRKGDPFSDRFNSMPKYVVSSTLKDAEWGDGSAVLEGDPSKSVAELKEKLDGDVIVHGSCQLVHELIDKDLVDELRLMVFPVVLGTGKRLFGETNDSKKWKLKESGTVGDEGVQTMVFEPA